MKITGCDFHPSYQQIAVLDSVTGEMVEKALSRERKEEVRAFYAQMVEPPRFHRTIRARTLVAGKRFRVKKNHSQASARRSVS
jgi:hypothetical protein